MSSARQARRSGALRPKAAALLPLQTAYNNNGAGPANIHQTVSLPAGCNATDTAVLIAFEYQGDTAAITAVAGLGAVWTKGVGNNNGAGHMGMSVWIGKGPLTAGLTDVTTTSSGAQANELHLSTWPTLVGNKVSAASSQALVSATTDTGIVAVTTGKLVIGGTVLNTSNGAPLPWTDTPGPWSDLLPGGGGFVDFWPAYRAVTAAGNHERTGVRNPLDGGNGKGNYVGTVVEIA